MSDFIPVCEPLLDGNEKKYVIDALDTGWISSSGKYVKHFEERFAEYCGVKYAVSVCNGTQALHLALVAAGIGKGDEVIIPNFTMVATAFAVVYTGAVPVFVDADEDTWNINTQLIEDKITERTRAIIPVHLFGLPCNMDEINRIAAVNDIIVIEDAAEAHGAKIDNRRTGSLSHIAAFSFYANKNLVTGEGGMVVTDNKDLYEDASYHKNLCFKLSGQRDFYHDDIGFNYRMTNLHAAIGLAQVEKAEYYKAKRIEHGIMYRKLLSNIPGIKFQKSIKGYENVYWMNALYIDPDVFGLSRDSLIDHLNKKGIGTRLLFAGMNLQKSLLEFSDNSSYPVSHKLYENGFYLPSGSGLTSMQIEYICETIRLIKERY